MQPIATDVARSIVFVFVLSVCVFGTWVSCTKLAKVIEMPFGMLTHVGPRNHVLNGIHISPRTLFEGNLPACCNIPMHECSVNCRCGRMCQPRVYSGWMHSLPWWVTRQWCGLLPNCFGHLLTVKLSCVSLKRLRRQQVLIHRKDACGWHHRCLFFMRFTVQTTQTALYELLTNRCQLTSFCMMLRCLLFDSWRCVHMHVGSFLVCSLSFFTNNFSGPGRACVWVCLRVRTITFLIKWLFT